ncbi:hypothetical protein [Streptomyces chartreusis]
MKLYKLDPMTSSHEYDGGTGSAIVVTRPSTKAGQDRVVSMPLAGRRGATPAYRAYASSKFPFEVANGSSRRELAWATEEVIVAVPGAVKTDVVMPEAIIADQNRRHGAVMQAVGGPFLALLLRPHYVTDQTAQVYA